MPRVKRRSGRGWTLSLFWGVTRQDDGQSTEWHSFKEWWNWILGALSETHSPTRKLIEHGTVAFVIILQT